MFGALGLPELVIILLIVMLLFGVGRVSQVGKELGAAIGAVRKSMTDDTDGSAQPAGAKSKKQ